MPLNERVEVQPVEPRHQGALAALLPRIKSFTPDEVACALEVFGRAAESGNREYVGLVAVADASVVGVIAYGQTPMTDGTYDMYWIACDPQRQRGGIGTALLLAMEADLRRRGARLVRVETSGTPVYQPTRAFYERFQYRETARLADFYRPGDDLVIFTKRL
jgi:ribosomal protein S18 acetylase RimI-like enzyme